MRYIQLVQPLVPAQLRALLLFLYYRLIIPFAAVAVTALEVGLRRGKHRDIVVPPPLLRHRVHGGLGRESFLRVGSICLEDMQRALRRVGRDLYSFSNVLDFGCGCGRILRHLAARPEDCHLFGTDIDPDAIAWCRKAIPFAKFEVNDRFPPAPFPGSLFDLVFGVSVFTHLNEREQLAWLGELRRMARRDAVLLLTVFSQHDHRHLSPEEQKRLAKEGFLYKRPKSLERPNAPCYPSCYGHAHHTRDYINRTWSKFFKIRDYIERGLNQHHDLVILQGNKASDTVDLQFENTSRDEAIVDG